MEWRSAVIELLLVDARYRPVETSSRAALIPGPCIPEEVHMGLVRWRSGFHALRRCKLGRANGFSGTGNVLQSRQCDRRPSPNVA
jgi:hypothetical protein